MHNSVMKLEYIPCKSNGVIEFRCFCLNQNVGAHAIKIVSAIAFRLQCALVDLKRA